MKRSLWVILLLITVVAACRKKDPAPSHAIEQLMGKWELVAYETMEDGERVWKETEGDSGYKFMFRFDGVILDSEGLPACCTLPYYFVSGVRFDVVPGAPVKDNPRCSLIDCLPCAEANYDLQEDGSLIYYCNPSGLRMKYERQ